VNPPFGDLKILDVSGPCLLESRDGHIPGEKEDTSRKNDGVDQFLGWAMELVN